MRKTLATFALFALPAIALAVTATKEYVDKQDKAISNLVVSVSARVDTNTVAIAAKADAVRTVDIGVTNLVVRPVYADSQLVIRGQADADGVKRYRLYDLD